MTDFTVPAGHEFDLERKVLDINLETSAIFSLQTAVIDVHGAAQSDFYGAYYGANNWGAGLACYDYRRVTAKPDSTGPNVVRKTALRATATSGYGQWLHSDNPGPYCQACRWITADNPTVYGDTSYSIPNIDVIQNTLDVTNAVVQWNVSPKSTGDYLRIARKDGSGWAFTLGLDGTITIDGQTLDQIIAAKVTAMTGQLAAKALPQHPATPTVPPSATVFASKPAA